MSHTANEFTVIQLNINSIQSKTKRIEFQSFLKKLKPQIIMLSETKLNKRHTLSFIGYKMLRNDRLGCSDANVQFFSNSLLSAD